MMKYPRRIFVAVVGMTPQVVTETLYALLQEKGEAPTEIHLITTSEICWTLKQGSFMPSAETSASAVRSNSMPR
jgi:CRISPR-associated protein (TIGR02584 family)